MRHLFAFENEMGELQCVPVGRITMFHTQGGNTLIETNVMLHAGTIDEYPLTHNSRESVKVLSERYNRLLQSVEESQPQS